METVKLVPIEANGVTAEGVSVNIPGTELEILQVRCTHGMLFCGIFDKTVLEKLDFPAAVFSAGMAFAVMVTVGSGIHQFSAEIGLNSFICVPGCTCTQFDPAFRKSRLGTAADAAADQDIDPLIIQQSGKGTVPAAVGTDDF